MRKMYTIGMLFAMLFVSSMITAQDILVVEPTDDLAALIDTHKGDKIYQLKAGEWYGLTKVLENVDFHLQIVGARR